MRIVTICMDCFRELGYPDWTSYSPDVMDAGIARFVCARGHRSIHVLQSQKFELLAEISVVAIFDGYYREAVSSFMSSLERYHEYYIKAVLSSRGYESEKIEGLWRRIKKQSERQYGAYNAVYMLEEAELPLFLTEKQVAFRNKVIHQGLIPTREEAIVFGQTIIDIINSSLEKLRSTKYDVLEKFERNDMAASFKLANDQGERASTLSIPTLLSWRRSPTEKSHTVSDWLELIQEKRSRHCDQNL